MAAVTLFAVFARPPGIMLSAQEDGLTFAICTGNGHALLTLPADEDENPARATSECAFFASHIGAFLNDAPSALSSKLPWEFQAQIPERHTAAKRREQSSHLTRGPPVLS